MARKSAPISYDTLILGRQDVLTDEVAAGPASEQTPRTAPSPSPVGELLRNVAQQYVVYMHPAAHKTIARYALEQSSHRNKVRPHDIIITAIEEYFERHGLPGPVRAKPKDK
jgi:hypothetical protein